MQITNTVRDVKTSLAKLLATENLTVQFAHVDTASFDVKTRVLTLPLFKETNETILDLFVGHEVAHALWTPCDGLENLPNTSRDFHSFVNVTEDARIERLIQSKYPGLKRVFYSAYGQLKENDFFGLSNIENIDDMLFIDRLNLKAKLGTQIGIEFSDVEEEFYNRAMTTVTFDDAVKLAEDIYEYCKEELEQKKQEEDTQTEELYQPAENEPGDDEGEDQTNQTQSQSRDVDVSDDGEDTANKEEESGSESEQIEDSTEDENADQSAIQDNEGDDAEEEELPAPSESEPGLKSITDQAGQNSIKQMTDDNLNNQISYLDLPKKIDISKFIVPFKQVHEEILTYWDTHSRRDASLAQNASVFKKKNQKVINYLHKEFEMKKAAEVYSKSFESKTGVINTQRLYSYKYTEDIFKKATTAPNGKSHGMVFFLDWSGSMAENMKGTMDQLINLALFCRKSNIPFNAYAFSSEYGKPKSLGNPENQSTNLNEPVLGECSLIELFNHKMNTRQFNRSIEIWLAVSTMFDRRSRGDFAFWGLPRNYYLSGTPLNEAIILATKVVPEFQKSANIQIVNTCFLTDGSSHSLAGQFTVDRSGLNIQSSEYQRANTLYIRDKKTAKSVVIKSEKYNRDSNRITKGLYMMLKGITGCNLVGFFVCDTKDMKYAYDVFYRNPEAQYETIMQANADLTDFRKMMSKEKSVIAMHSGMDELYIIKGGKALEINDEGLQVADSASKAQITTAFKKMTKGKLQNRVILQKFIEKIAA